MIPDLTGGICLTHPEPWIWNNSHSSVQVAESKRLCDLCPVEKVCLEWTMTIESNGGRRAGTAGGLTGRQRKALCKGKPPVPPHGTLGRYRLEILAKTGTCQVCRNAMAKSRKKSYAKLHSSKKAS